MIVVARTIYGDDIIGNYREGDEYIQDVWRIVDIDSAHGITPMLRPMRSVIFNKHSDGTRVVYKMHIDRIMKKESIQSLECDQSAKDFLVEMYESFCEI